MFPHSFSYKSVRISDHSLESLLAVLDDVLEWINAARLSGGRVFVHCVQVRDWMRHRIILWQLTSFLSFLPTARAFLAVLRLSLRA